MEDTAQPMAAETDPMADAANAFKVELGQVPEKPRDERGRFAPTQTEENAPESAEQEIETEDEGEQPEPEVDDSEAETDDLDEADSDEESQPEPVAMPASWAKEDAEIWSALPPEAQAKIAAREGQRDSAVNQKFQEAANLRRDNEAVIREAANNRDRFAQMAEVAMSMLRPTEPSLSMLDYNSDDYDPDAYHLRRAQYEQQMSQLSGLSAQLQQVTQEREQEQQREMLNRYHEINRTTREALARDVPEITDQAKAPAIIGELIDYAKSLGAPEAMFETPTTALEWHVLWKAQQFDKLQSAKSRVGKTPAPEPRKAQPAVRPGVTTSRSAVKQVQRQKDFSRLAKSGSVEDGAAVWKHFLKG